MTISFFAPGTPKGQPRPRAFARKFGDKYAARVYDAGTAEGWKSEIAVAARAHLPTEPIATPLVVSLEFTMPRPKGHYGSGSKSSTLKASAPTMHTGKPDCDNLAKAVLDALTTLGMWVDDCHIVKLTISKRYGAHPGCQIEISGTENHQWTIVAEPV